MKAITQTTVNRWAAHLSVGGLRRWWAIGSLTRHRDQPAAARLLAQCLQKNAPPTMSQRAGKALRGIISQSAVDTVIDCWLEDKAGETVRMVIEERGWRHSNETRWLSFLTKRKRFDEYFVAQLAPLVNDPAVARMLVHPEGVNADEAATAAAAVALGRISAPQAVDAVIDCWLEDKAGETALRTIEEQGWRHSDETQWFKFLSKRNRFDEYFDVKIAPLLNNPVIVRMLAHPEAANADQTAVAAASAALCQISAQETVDAVIDCWLEDKAGKTAQQVIEEQGWRHSEEASWLKFLTKRNRFDEYFVAELTPLVNDPAVARMLVHPEGVNADEAATAAAAVALGQISAQETVDAVIDCWLEDKAGETARQLIEERGWRRSQELRWINFFTRRNHFDEFFVAELTPLVNNPAVARMLVHPEGVNADEAATAAAAVALGQISAPQAVDAVIDCWLEDKAGETVRMVIEERGWRHSNETRWLSFLTKRKRFDEYFVAELTPLVNNPAVARMLVHPEGVKASNRAAEAAAAALGQISETKTVDAVIDCWLEDKAGETALRTIEEQGWRHTDETRWFLFLTKRNRFDEYFVSELSLRVNEPVIARMLVLSEEANADQAATEAAAAALGRISAPEAVDAVIDRWLWNKSGETVRMVIEEQGWRHSDETRWLSFLTQRNRFDEYFVAQLAPLINRPEIAKMLAHPEGATASQTTSVATAVALRQITMPDAIDAVIDCWLEDKAGETALRTIEEQGWRHTDETRWFLFLTKRNRFDEYFVAELKPMISQPAVARMLAHPEAANANQTAITAAAAALRQISLQETVDTVIDCWLEDKAGEIMRLVIEEQGWRHSQEARWFLYLAATGRFDEYLAEDYEFQTLRPEFLAAPVTLKARIREAIVKAGEVRMNGLFLAEKRTAELNLADAEALVRTNIRNQNWEALVENLWWLPARQIHDAVQAIIAADWKPDGPDQAALLTRLGEIAHLLATGAPEKPGTLPLNLVYQKWLASGETGPLSQTSPAELKTMLRDETDPPEQIAALGALRKQGQLDSYTVSKAGLSQHWMVRWVAVHFGADLTQAMRVNDAGIEWFRRLTILKDTEVLWIAKPSEVTRDGLETLRDYIARLPDRRTAGGLLLVEAICTHYTSHDIEVEEGTRVMVAEDSFELEA